MRTLLLDAVDTLLLRDGRPFNQDDVGLTRAFSHFPPFPWVLAGAIRAAYARQTGWWDRDGGWQAYAANKPEAAATLGALGNGLFDTGDLTFDAPLLAIYHTSFAETLFPCPASILARRAQPGERPPDHANSSYSQAIAVSPRPASERRSDQTDNQAFHLDSTDDADFTPLPDHWVTKAAMREFLAGEPILSQPSFAIWEPRMIASPELRIGLERDQVKHRAVDGMLYSASHRRPADRIRLLVRYRFDESSPLAAVNIGRMLALGGQGRMAVVEPEAQLVTLDDLEPSELKIDGDGRFLYTTVLIAPVTFDTSAGEQARSLHDLPGELVASAHSRAVTFAGWDQGASTRLHRRYCPAGAVFYFRARHDNASALLEEIRKVQQCGLGAAGPCRTGCGRFLIGTWLMHEHDGREQN